MLDAPSPRHRSNGLDILRAIFALFVIFSHVIPWAFVAQGPGAAPAFLRNINDGFLRLFQAGGETNPGVLGFIVLSGYCIHRAGFRHGRSDIRDYASRRVWRIYPTYVAATVVGIIGAGVAAWLSPNAQAFTATPEFRPGCLIGKLFAIPALLPTAYSCSFGGNAPLATVAAEIGLYALYPVLLLIICRTFGERLLWILIVSAWSFGTFLIVTRPDLRGWWHNGSVAGFLLYWWIGAKFLDRAFYDRVRQQIRYFVLAWLTLTVVIWLAPQSGWVVPVVELRKVIFALLIGVFISWIDLKPIKQGFLVELGQAGYSLYAFHAPVLYILLIIGVPWWGTIVTALICGFLGYRLIERPTIAYMKNSRPNQIS